MVTIEGLVCQVPSEGRVLLFGRGEGPEPIPGRFGENRLSAFPDVHAATDAFAVLRERFPDARPKIRRVRVRHAETPADLGAFQSARRLVLIGLASAAGRGAGPYAGVYGPIVPGRPTILPIPAASFWENGLVPFPTFAAAEETAHEFTRQGQQPSTIGTLELT